MTHRARAIAFLGLLGLFLGSVRGQAMLSLISFSAIAWVLLEWLRFRASLRLQLPRLRIERSINDRPEASGTLWAGRAMHVALHVRSSSPAQSIIEVRDAVSEVLAISPSVAAPAQTAQADKREGAPPQSLYAGDRHGLEAQNAASEPAGEPATEPDWETQLRNWLLDAAARAQRWVMPEPEVHPPNYGRLEPGSRHLQVAYEAQLHAAGRIAFPGVRLTIRDEYGLFEFHRFIKLEQSYRVLPKYYPSGEFRPTVKRYNTLPRHGIHRLERSGMGSELLELREYVTGDPPKSIAWKASARRDKLLTRQYESEVPVRVHLIIDGSMPTRAGAYGRRPLDHINYAAASIAKAAIAVGDPVDALLIDERGTKRIGWATGDRGFLELLKALADFSLAPPPPPVHSVSREMIERAIGVCQHRYPELLDRRFNQTPLSVFISTHKRYRLVGVLAEVLDLSPLEQVECMHDDARLALHLQQFLWQAGVPWMTPVASVAAESTKDASVRIEAIGRAILRAIAHARDNEVFVVLADLVSSASNLPSLIHAVKLALAKHHRVAFICPTTNVVRPKAEIVLPRSDSLHDLLSAAEQARERDLALHMKRELVRLGASVSFSGQQSAIQMVIDEMDTVRSGRTRRQGARS